MSDEEETFENGEDEDAAEEAPETEAAEEEEAPNSYRNRNNHRRYYDDFSSGEEYEAELVHSWSKPPQRTEEVESKEMSEAEKALMAQKKKHEADDAEKLKEYEEQRRIQREKDEEELRLLKEKQERRRQEREEEDRLMQQKRKEEEDRRKQEEEQKKTKAEEERKRKQEEKNKKQAMMPGLQTSGTGGPNFEITKADPNQDKFDKFGNIMKAKEEMGQTKQQHEEQKKKFLQDSLKSFSTEGMDASALKSKIKELHQRICKLEALRYDMEQRQVRQDYDLKELNERQRQISRNKALKKGLDPEEAATSRHPPKVPVASKYDRQTDRRSYGDKRYLFENPKKRKEPKIFHGSARPPNEWGAKTNEELENIKKNLGPPKYVETVKAENARPPMEPIPVQLPPDDEEGGEE